jgi:hypothetical protein
MSERGFPSSSFLCSFGRQDKMEGGERECEWKGYAEGSRCAWVEVSGSGW